MPKIRREDADNRQDNDLDSLPIPIQSFLWRQLSPFVRPYNRKLQEATCVTFERTVVQNIVHGLSPSLSEAIQSIPRWRFLVATLPYVLHCCASSVELRRSLEEQLSPNSTKLLYTLHWLFLDAATECADQERERRKNLPTESSRSPTPYLYPVSSIQVFVYLFAPLLPRLQQSDFKSFRLENGLKIWGPLWDFRQPDIPLLSAPVKPTRTTETVSEEMPHTGADVGDIYIGTQRDESFVFGEPERNPEEELAAMEAVKQAKNPNLKSLAAPIAHMSDICTLTTMETPVSPLAEQICEFCNSRIYPAEKGLLRCKCGHRRPKNAALLSALPIPVITPRAPSLSPIDKEFLQKKLDLAITAEGSSKSRDVTLATYFDVAVLRCMLPPWTEEGMFWAMRYFANCLVEIRDHLQRTRGLRHRSNSVPSIHSNRESKPGSPSRSPKHHRSVSPPNKKSLTKIDLLSPMEPRGSKRRRLGNNVEAATFFVGGGPLRETSNSLSSPMRNQKIHGTAFSFGGEEGKDFDSPSGTRLGTSLAGSNPATPRERNLRRSGKSFPRITITTDNSPQSSVLDEDPIVALSSGETAQPTLTRSKTDSHISYPIAEYQEAHGASNLVEDTGELNYQALLRAVLVALSERPSQRVCDVALGLLDVVLDLLLDIQAQSAETEGEPVEFQRPAVTATSSVSIAAPVVVLRDVITHRLLMTCITRVFIIIGCAYGCGRDIIPGRVTLPDFLRRQAHVIFQRIQSVNEAEASKYLKAMVNKSDLRPIVDFCHAYFGSCVSPAAQEGGRLSKSAKKTHSWLASQVARPLCHQLVQKLEEIRRPDNTTLQNDLRNLLSYLKEAHDSVFRRVVVAGVMESQQRQLVTTKSSIPGTPFSTAFSQASSKRKPLTRNNRIESTEEAPVSDVDIENQTSLEESTPSARYLRGIFAKKPKVSLKPLRSRESSETNLRAAGGSRSPRVSVSEDESVINASPTRDSSRNARGKRHGLRQRWLKSPKSSGGSKDSRGGMFRSESVVSGDNSSETISRQQSLESGQFGPKGHGKHRTSIKDPSRINSVSIRMPALVDQTTREDDLRSIMRKSETFTSEPATTSVRNVLMLNSVSLTKGMKCLGTLLEFCPPGILPEPTVLAAMLDIQAPVIARAAFFLECANFVHKLNQGKWPDWMRQAPPQVRYSGPTTRLAPQQTPRKQHILQRSSGKIFHEWARCITHRLDDILKAESVDPSTLVSPKYIVDDEDYFLPDNDNFETGGCPFVIRLAACQLILEITAFLRETYRNLPKKERLGLLRSQAKTMEKRNPGGVRRFSSVASNSGGNSHQSIHSFVEPGLVHVYPAGHVPGERRISFMLTDDTVSQRSGSSNGPEADQEKRTHLLKSGRDRVKQHAFEGASGRRRSIRLRKESQDETRRSRTDSIRSRKASSISARSDLSQSSSVDEPATPHGDEPREVFGLEEAAEYTDQLPWMDCVINICSRFSFICDHKKACTVFCFYRLMRAAARLTWSLARLHGDRTQQRTVKASMDEENEAAESLGRSGTQTPTTPSSHRRLRILRKPSQYPGLGRLSKAASALEKNESVESINRLAQSTADYRDLASKSAGQPYDPFLEPVGEMVTYIKQRVVSLFAAPFSLMAKGFFVMDTKQLEKLFPVCWELLLVDDEEVSSVCATLCIVCSVKISKFVTDILRKEMNHENPEERVDTILKFQTLWRYRHQVWIRLEEGAQSLLRVSQALNIDYTLPSPLIGRMTVDCPDAPWLPPVAIKVEEVAISQEEQSKNSNTLVAATQTRRKQLQESMGRALRAQEERNQREREKTRITMLPILKMAAIEPISHQIVEDKEEVDEGAPTAEPNAVAVHAMTYQPVFPSSLAGTTLQLIELMDDADVDSCGISVGELACRVLWEGIVEDSTLFLRYILEKVSNREKQNHILMSIRKLMGTSIGLPPQAACTLFNHLLGYCMSFVRSPTENNFNGVEAVMSVVWKLIPSVEGISFREIKAVLRREQCDPHLLLTANVPGAKKVVVHGPDLTSVPSQLPVNEDTQFEDVLRDSLEFFDIPRQEWSKYLLADAKTGRVHHPNSYIRDVYFFRRSFYPQLNLVSRSEKDNFVRLQIQAYHNLFLESQKVLLVHGLYRNARLRSDFALSQQMVMVLEDGLTKLPNFPRKALETDVTFYSGTYGAEYLGIDVLHKFSWVQMVANVLCNLTRPNSDVQLSESDVHMLLSVLNGVFLLHCQDVATLRLTLATYITLAKNLKHLFSTSGFLTIMPVILRNYAYHQGNAILTYALEFACSQFFVLHRNPFLLQMFSAAAGLLEIGQSDKEPKPLQRIHIRKILFSLEKYSRRLSKVVSMKNNEFHHPLDDLEVLEQVEAKKPLQPLDLCYQNDVTELTHSTILSSAVSSCIAVIAFDTAESPRGTQMLQILRTLLHEDVWYLEKSADNVKTGKEELQKIVALAGSLKSLIMSCESLTKPFNVPQRFGIPNEAGKVPGAQSPNRSVVRRDTDVEALRTPKINAPVATETPESETEFSSPRNHLLAIVAHFVSTASVRIRHLTKFLGELATRPPELIDAKAHIRLAEIAHTLLKAAPYDKEVMACEGLEMYMTEILPTVDFSIESLKPPLQMLLRRIDKTFMKVMKKPNMRRDTDWNAASKIIQGLTKTICNNNLMALMPQLRSITANCIHMVLGEQTAGTMENIAAAPGSPIGSVNQLASSLLVPTIFRQATIDLCAAYLQAGKEYCNLEQLCAQFFDRMIGLVVNFLLPFILRIGSESAELPPIRMEDLRYVVRVLVQLLHPPPTLTKMTGAKQLSVNPNITRTNSNISNPPSSGTHPQSMSSTKQQELSRTVAFLGFKIVLVAYEGRLGSEWLRLGKSIQEFGEKGVGGPSFWRFLEFSIVNRTALFVHLAPYASRYFELSKRENEAEQQLLGTIIKDLQGGLHNEKPRDQLLVQVQDELHNIMEEYAMFSNSQTAARYNAHFLSEEGSAVEHEPLMRLNEIANRVRYGRRADRKESVQVEHPSTAPSIPGRRSPPIVIPVKVEKTVETKPVIVENANSKAALHRQKPARASDKARFLSKNNSADLSLSEAIEMVPIAPVTKQPAVANHVDHPPRRSSQTANQKRNSEEKMISIRRESLESLNDDEEVSLLKT